jgi:hypothetical protein
LILPNATRVNAKPLHNLAHEWYSSLMATKFDYPGALEFLAAQTTAVAAGDYDAAWEAKIRQLSQLCEKSGVRTHIAFLGTALLAKSLDDKLDPHTVKPTHAPDPSRAYPARSLAERVLVPASIEHGFDIGATGREPLNNQPYFRMRWLGDGTPISPASRPAFDYMCELVKELESLDSTSASAALRAFILVRREYRREFEVYESGVKIPLEVFAATLGTFVQDNSENGRRAQAVTAGLIDTVYGAERVTAGRINDPSRKYPGDVCVTSKDGSTFIKAIEVRDKVVSDTDALVFAAICKRHGVSDASIIMTSPSQIPLDITALAAWSISNGVAFKLFYGWEELVEDALYWADAPMREALDQSVPLIEARLREVEVSEDGYRLWAKLFRD